MKRFWLGVGLLLVLLGLGIAVGSAMAGWHKPIAHKLEQAAAVCGEDWQQAQTLADSAKEDWERCRTLTAMAADHEPMDEVEMLLAELSVYAHARDDVHFRATCARAARLIEAVAQAHSLTWENFW